MKFFPSLLLATLLGGFSNATMALDLVQIYELAKNQDAQLKIAASQLESTRATLPQAKSSNLPQINLSAQTTLSDGTTSSAEVEYDQTSTGFTLSLQQSLYNSKISAQTDAAEAGIRQAEADFTAAEQDLIIRVTEAYFNVLSAQDNVEFAQAEKNAIGRQLEQAQKRFEVGLIAITDVKEAQASFDLSVSQEIIANNELDNAKQALQLIIGESLAEPLSILGEEVELAIPEPENSNAWTEQALQTNPGLVAAEAALEAANDNRRIARADRRPTVDLVASYQNNSIDDDLSTDYDTDDTSLSIQLNLPLYTGGRTSAVIEQAEFDYATAQNNLLLQKRLVAQQTNNAYLNVVAGIGQVNALKQALISSQAALEATEAGFDVGTRTSVDVLISLRGTFRSQTDYASARYEYLVNTLRLKQAAGLLNEQDLYAVNLWLNN
ncbi:MAG: TolC family outer membrane protein [Gammaproteobacteria bacterium]|nr:TolC family outer membrane protein [Gammaproteobacteria bacterium]